MLRIILTGGGTGGHIYPLIAVAEEIGKIAAEQKIRVRISYLGAPGDFKSVLKERGLYIYTVRGGKIRNYASLMNVVDVFLVGFALVEALFKLYFLMPDAVFSKGGPGSYPVILAARFYRIPVIIHDSDAVPGRSNIAAAKYAVRIGISFPGAAGYFSGKNTALTGNPVRTSLFENKPERTVAINALGFSAELPLVLVLGGSQGATRINDFIVNNLELLINETQVLHQTGRAHINEVRGASQFVMNKTPSEKLKRYKPVPYLNDEEMQRALAAADLVVARAGAGTIFELAAFGKPSILIPLPEGNDQRANAYALADFGATVVIEQENLLPNLFEAQIKKILGDKALRESMGQAALTFAKPDAARVIAEEVLKIAIG